MLRAITAFQRHICILTSHDTRECDLAQTCLPILRMVSIYCSYLFESVIFLQSIRIEMDFSKQMGIKELDCREGVI